MIRLFSVIYTLASVTLAGSAIVAALTLGMFGARPIVVAAVIGAVAAMPVAWTVTKKLSAI
ncbi:CTP synthetase [Defluviimonas aestuarii]|uniref:CTP synthetase n=1 Tax=Albidovulum aestuarii TaxID=1130726 RepID=UPI00249B4B55|nr:CTP synthetase [Defluviimonas aestuarii]MDI3336223.1 CTP synthetase [Defluviimonas aestuarii]